MRPQPSPSNLVTTFGPRARGHAHTRSQCEHWDHSRPQRPRRSRPSPSRSTQFSGSLRVRPDARHACREAKVMMEVSGCRSTDSISATAKATSAGAASSRRVATCRPSEGPTGCAGASAASCGGRTGSLGAGMTEHAKSVTDSSLLLSVPGDWQPRAPWLPCTRRNRLRS